MKKIKNILFLFVVAIAFVSCSNKCVDCGDCPNGVDLTNDDGEVVSSLELCKEDFDGSVSTVTYDEAIDILEDLGCDCK